MTGGLARRGLPYIAVALLLAACGGKSQSIVNAVITLQPGEAALQEWNVVYEASTSLPAECTPGGCAQVPAIQPGTFTFTAGTGIDCSQFGDGACTTCMPDSNGGCTTYGALVTSRSVPALTSVTLDASYSVGLSGAPLRSVELVFEE